MKKLLTLLMAAGCFTFTGLTAAEATVGFVNFKTCIEKSKRGQQEKNALESMKKSMTESLEKMDKEMVEVAKKLEDQDYMDSLSPAAEEEMKQKFQMLSQEFSRCQNQYYQLLNQANYKMLQSMHDEVATAASHVREARKLLLILNEDSTFAYSPELDFTEDVVTEMNRYFEQENIEVVSKEA